MPTLPRKALRHQLVTLAFWLVGLSPFVAAQQLPLKSYTTADGLAHNGVNRIVKDSRGFLWFCTEEGLSRFDGYSFTNYGVEQGLPHRTVTDFLETRAGEFWLATYGGLVRFNPQGAPANRVVYANEGITPAPMFTVVVPKDDHRYARAVTALLETRDGAIWCGTRKHLYRLERQGGRFELLLIDLGPESLKRIEIWDLLEDRYGSLWVATLDPGLFRRWPDGSAAMYTKLDGLPVGWNHLHDLLEDHLGRLWIATRHAGFFRVVADGSHAPPVVAEAYNYQNGLTTNWVFQLYEASDHRLWVATYRGLVEFFPDGDGQGRRFRVWTRRNGLSYTDINTLGEDTGGNLWVGMNSNGTMKLARNGFVTYGAQDGLMTVTAIFEDPAGGVCFRGTVLEDQRAGAFDGAKLDLLRAGADTVYSRFGRFDGRRFDWFTPAIPFEFGWFPEQVAVQTHNGEWWVGSPSGLYRFPASDNFASTKTARPLAVYTTKDGLPSPVVWKVFTDSGDNVWVSANGLARWDRSSQTVRDLSNSPNLPSYKEDNARSFGEDRAGNIWIGFNTGVARYRDGHFTFFTTSEGLPPGGILDIHSDHAGRLWLASARGGLIRLDDTAAERPAFKSYSTAQGLSANSAEVITEDLYGRIYVATGRGLDQLNPETGRIKHFTTADGLVQGNIVAAFRDRTGAIWVGAHRGLSRFVPAPTETAPPPPILITGLRVAGERRSVSALGETGIALADLAPDRNQLQIDFVALGFAPGEVLRYQYRLEGSDADWGALSEQRTVNFASLAPGRYRFLVRAMNSDGVASANPATVTFSILRPIWQRSWFLSLSALVIGLTALAFYRSRIRRIVELERVRTRIATDLHDDIGSSLSQIAILSEVSRRRLGKEQNGLGESLAHIANTSRDLVDSMSDIVWAINPRRDRVSDLTQRMREFAGDVFTAREIEFSFRAPAGGLELRLDAGVRRQLYLIFKEVVNNAARHSRCTQAEIEFEVAPGRLLLLVRDNGRGFDPNGEATIGRNGNGLVSMRERARAMGGEIEIISQENQGTAVRLDLPIGPRAGSRWRKYLPV